MATVNVADENFETAVIKAGKPVIICNSSNEKKIYKRRKIN